MALAHFVRAVKSPTTVQRVFRNVDSVIDLGHGARIVRMQREHIPTVMPTFHEFWMNEVTSMSVGCDVTETHLWPILFNLTRTPHSYLLLKDDEIAAHGLQWLLYKNPEEDPNPVEKAELNMNVNDPFRTVVSMVDHVESRIFDIFPSESVLLHSLAAYVRPPYQLNGLMTQLAMHINRLNMALSSFVRAVKSPTTVQRVFRNVDSVVDLGHGARIVRMQHEHIPTVMPTFHEFWLNEVTRMSVGCDVTESHLWPILFNLTRNPHSYLLSERRHLCRSMALKCSDRDDEIAAHGLQWLLYKNPEEDPNPVEKAELNMDVNDPFRTVVSMVDHVESRIFDIFPSESVLLHSLAAYVRPPYQLNGLMTQLAMHINRLNMESLLPLGIKGSLGVTTRIQNQRVLGKLGWKKVGTVEDSIYYRPDGSRVEFLPSSETNGAIVFFDFKENIANAKELSERKMGKTAILNVKEESY